MGPVTPKKERAPQGAEMVAATEPVWMAKEQGLALTGPKGLLKQLTKTVIETALNEEMTEYLGYGKNDPAGRESSNIRNGIWEKTILTDSVGSVEIDIPRDRAGTCEPVIPGKRQRRLGEVDEVVLTLSVY
jgi:putative transposase